MYPQFPTDFESILKRVLSVDPIRYSKTRNFISGHVTYLSPYITHGVITLPFIQEHVLKKYTVRESEKFISELAWREFFQRWYFSHGDTSLWKDIKHDQLHVVSDLFPRALLDAKTGIKAIDTAVRGLYESGYIHNHARMWIASLVANIAKTNWRVGARWMYYHLLDGDIASNTLSWQWCAGTFSHKRYFANQDNLNFYAHTSDKNTFLDTTYDILEHQDTPPIFSERLALEYKTELLHTDAPLLDRNLPTLIYHPFALDPQWHNARSANRVLILSPRHFAKYPISKHRLNFIHLLSKNIPHLQVYVGEYEDLNLDPESTYIKYHPTVAHYLCIQESREALFPAVTGSYNTFTPFWNECKKYLGL